MWWVMDLEEHFNSLCDHLLYKPKGKIACFHINFLKVFGDSGGLNYFSCPCHMWLSNLTMLDKIGFFVFFQKTWFNFQPSEDIPHAFLKWFNSRWQGFCHLSPSFFFFGVSLVSQHCRCTTNIYWIQLPILNGYIFIPKSSSMAINCIWKIKKLHVHDTFLFDKSKSPFLQDFKPFQKFWRHKTLCTNQ